MNARITNTNYDESPKDIAIRCWRELYKETQANFRAARRKIERLQRKKKARDEARGEMTCKEFP